MESGISTVERDQHSSNMLQQVNIFFMLLCQPENNMIVVVFPSFDFKMPSCTVGFVFVTSSNIVLWTFSETFRFSQFQITTFLD